MNKGRSKKQTKVAVYVGMAPRTATFDVSKSALDISVLQGKDERLLTPKQVTIEPVSNQARLKRHAIDKIFAGF